MSETAQENQQEAVDPLDALAELETQEREGSVAAEPDAPAETDERQEGETAEEHAERLWAGKYRSPEDLESAYGNAESELGRLRNELGQRNQLLEQYERTYQPPGQQEAAPAQAQPSPLDGLPQYTAQELEEMATDDPIALVDYIVSVRLAQDRVEQERRLAPVFETVHDANAQSAIAKLKSEFGDDVLDANRDAIANAIKSDNDFYLDPATRHARLRMTVQAAEFERARAATGAGTPAGQFATNGVGNVHTEGGSEGQLPSPAQIEDPDVAAIDNSGSRRDVFGALPGLS
jgi:hypothetical protein